METEKKIRAVIRTLLATAGAVMLLMAFGSDSRPLGEFIILHLALFAAAMGAFYLQDKI